MMKVSAMNCKQAKAQLALLAGNDLEPAACQIIRRHLDQCDACRQHLRRLSSCLEVLQTPSQGPWNLEQESLWPQLSVRLSSGSNERPPHRLNGWAATVAVAAACTAMFWVASRQGSNDVMPFRDPIDSQSVGVLPSYEPLPELEPFLPHASDDSSDIIRLRSRGAGRVLVVPVNQPQPQ
jgi:hypothetical protein